MLIIIRKFVDNTVQKKLLQSPKDIFLRRILIERCSLDYKSQLFHNKKFLTIDEVASYLGLNKRTIQNKVSQGKFLKPKKPGGTVVCDREKFLDWCRRQ